MRASTNLHRALVGTSIEIHKRMEQRRDNSYFDQYGEREQQLQHEFAGTIGNMPGGTEGTFKVLFDVVFVGDPGSARDSQLGEPVVRFGFRMSLAPPGTAPYAHVSDWVLDDDFNFIGAIITFGVHGAFGNPGPFKGLLHSTFQGYGAPIEDYTGGTGGGDTPDALGGDQTRHSPIQHGTDGQGPPIDGTVVVPGGTPPYSAGGTQGGGGAPGQGPGQGGSGSGPGGTTTDVHDGSNPTGPVGPLGSDHLWTPVSTFPPAQIGDIAVVPGKAAKDTSSDYSIQVDGNGVLTTADPYKITMYTTNKKPGSHPTAPGNQGGMWYRGDKYALQWLKPGKTADGFKLRVRVTGCGGANGPAGRQVWAIVVNMKDRSTGLAFWFGLGGAGWVRDLRRLGTVQQDVGDFTFGQNFGALEQTRVAQYAGNPDPSVYHVTGDLWAELWRDGDHLRAGVWMDNPDTSQPFVLSTHDVVGDPLYGQGASGYWGLTADWLGLAGMQVYSYNNPGHLVNSGSPAQQNAGFKEITLYQKAS